MLDKEKILNTIQSATNPLPLIEALVRVADIADKYYRGADCSCDNCFQCDFAKAIAELERLVEGEK